MNLKKKIEETIVEFLEMNEIEITDDDWIELNDNEHVLVVHEATININNKKPNDIGLSFNVNSERENVFHLTNILSNMSKNTNLFLIESFMFDENGNFITGKDAYRLKEEIDLKCAACVLHEQQIKQKMNENCIN